MTTRTRGIIKPSPLVGCFSTRTSVLLRRFSLPTPRTPRCLSTRPPPSDFRQRWSTSSSPFSGPVVISSDALRTESEDSCEPYVICSAGGPEGRGDRANGAETSSSGRYPRRSLGHHSLPMARRREAQSLLRGAAATELTCAPAPHPSTNFLARRRQTRADSSGSSRVAQVIVAVVALNAGKNPSRGAGTGRQTQDLVSAKSGAGRPALWSRRPLRAVGADKDVVKRQNAEDGTVDLIPKATC